MKPLIPDRVMQQLAAIADRSRRSSCVILHRDRVRNDRGGSTLGPESRRGPFPCRLDPSGLSGQEGLRGEQMTSTAYATVALPLGIEAPVADDKLEVTTVLPDGVTTTVETFNVVGDPFATSYAVELQVPVTRIGG